MDSSRSRSPVLNLPLGTALTGRAVLPAGAVRSLKDPYADRAAARRQVIFWMIMVALVAGLAAARYQHVWPFAPLP